MENSCCNSLECMLTSSILLRVRLTCWIQNGSAVPKISSMFLEVKLWGNLKSYEQTKLCSEEPQSKTLRTKVSLFCPTMQESSWCGPLGMLQAKMVCFKSFNTSEVCTLKTHWKQCMLTAQHAVKEQQL